MFYTPHNVTGAVEFLYGARDNFRIHRRGAKLRKSTPF
jgi:hypothetical protein